MSCVEDHWVQGFMPVLRPQSLDLVTLLVLGPLETPSYTQLPSSETVLVFLIPSIDLLKQYI